MALGERARVALALALAAAALPALAASYVVMRLSKALWLRALAARHPTLEWVRADTVRALLDTPRNQGIINVLLQLRGAADAERTRRALLAHVVERREAGGELMFPRMRQVLTSCWGTYAWDPSHIFRLENHFVQTSGVYRGRPVTDNNIQDYVSEIISKYFPNDQPPWQYFVIPCVSAEPKYYILVRVHHLLLTGHKSINIGDLLMLEQRKDAAPADRLLPTPSAIAELWDKTNAFVVNSWNDFTAVFDPEGNPEALKRFPGAFHVAALLLIAAVRALSGLGQHGAEPALAVHKFLAAFRMEIRKRNLTFYKIIMSPIVTLDPRKWPRTVFSSVFVTLRALFALPRRLRAEWRGSARLWAALGEAARAPLSLWRDTVGADDGERHLLQQASLCGRKVAAWSGGVPRSSAAAAARRLGVPLSCVTLSACLAALRPLFVQSQAAVPRHVLATARAHTQDFLFTFAEGDGKRYKKSLTGGMVCLRLGTVWGPRAVWAHVRGAGARQRALAAGWAAQGRCGALTRALPSPLARLALNLLSRRYALSYTELTAPAAAAPRATLWGQPVDAVLYWRPPQANISVSLTVIQYADTIRLTVMADARLSPAHAAPAVAWPRAMEDLMRQAFASPSVERPKAVGDQRAKEAVKLAIKERKKLPEVEQQLIELDRKTEQETRSRDSSEILESSDSESGTSLEGSLSPGTLRVPPVAATSPPVRRKTPQQ